MQGNRLKRILKMLPFGVAFFAVAGFLVMYLWNWLMPAVFGLKAIGFWKAIGLVILSRILFGGFRGAPDRGMFWRRRMMRRWAERWEQMTPEEREKFRAGLRNRCGPFEPPQPKPTA